MKDASNVIYAPEGYVLFVREGALFAQRFDLRSLSLQGEPLLLEEQVVFNPQWRFSGLSVSNNGILSYATRRPSWNELVWFDRHGRRLGSLGAPSHRFNPHLSPDDERIAVEQLDPETGNWDIWTVDAQSGDPARVTFAPSLERHPVWSPDGTRLALISTQGGYARVYQKFLRGSGELDLLLGSNLIHNGLTSWSKDGALLMQILTLETDEDCWVLTLNETPTSEPFLQGPSAEIHSQISSDGRWVAYSSNETGKFEVYVSSYPSNDAPMRVSTAGGYQPRWRGDDQELYYLSPEGKLMAAKAKSGRRLVFSEPSALFPITTEPEIRERWTYDVASDGQRFLFVVRLDGGSSSISVVVNWTEKLKR
jgi:Tol biopolymer transport system component